MQHAFGLQHLSPPWPFAPRASRGIIGPRVGDVSPGGWKAHGRALFGYRLQAFGIATNKALAAAGRDEPRDVVDLILVHERHAPLGAVIWPAVAKDPGGSPQSLIAEVRRNARYRQDDFDDLSLASRMAALTRRFRTILSEAEDFVRAMPLGKEGLASLRPAVLSSRMRKGSTPIRTGLPRAAALAFLRWTRRRMVAS